MDRHGGVSPSETMEWVEARRRDIGFNPSREKLVTPEQHERPFIDQYMEFRELTRLHIGSGQEPILALSQAPTGGYEWLGRREPGDMMDDMSEV